MRFVCVCVSDKYVDLLFCILADKRRVAANIINKSAQSILILEYIFAGTRLIGTQ